MVGEGLEFLIALILKVRQFMDFSLAPQYMTTYQDS